MANSKSALKRVRQTTARTVRNRVLKTRIKTARKALQTAIASGDAASVNEKFRSFASVADRAAKANVIHRKAASRLKSRLEKAIKTGA